MGYLRRHLRDQKEQAENIPAKKDHIKGKIHDLKQAVAEVFKSGANPIRNPATMLAGARASQIRPKIRSKPKSNSTGSGNKMEPK